MNTRTDADIKRYAMTKHAMNILTDAICDLHCANELGEKNGFRISDTVFDHLTKLKEEMQKEIIETGTRTGML